MSELMILKWRSIRPDVSCKNRSSKKFRKIHRKKCRSLFWSNFFIEHLRWLLLKTQDLWMFLEMKLLVRMKYHDWEENSNIK